MKQIYLFLETLIKYAIPISNFLIALIAFSFTSATFFRTRAKLKIHFLENENIQYLIDREKEKLPDYYWDSKYRLFPKVAISNNSSHPITIYEFVLNNKYSFDIDTEFGSDYSVTLKSNIENIAEGVIGYTSDDILTLNIPLSNTTVLKPVITLKPYETCVGYLFFWYDNQLPFKNKITIKTSRRYFSKTLKVSGLQKSVTRCYYKPPRLDIFDQE